jgi:hypothetical protein
MRSNGGRKLGGLAAFDFYAGTATTEAAAPFAVFERACPELSRRVRALRQPIAKGFSFVPPALAAEPKSTRRVPDSRAISENACPERSTQ